MAMSEAAKAARREYMRQYRIMNGEKLRQQARDRYKKDPEKYLGYTKKSWEKKAKELQSH